MLLSLIATHELDITEVALSVVTDEFIAHVAALPDDDLDAMSEFLVVAATLLDMKVAGLLPQGEVVDAEGLAALEARDLLFARLLQYRAFKDASVWFADALETELGRHAAAARLDVPPAPPVVQPVDLAELAALAAVALVPKPPKLLSTTHLHAPVVSLREQAAIVVAILRSGPATFQDLIGDETDQPVVVARFLAVLELYRHGSLALEQLEPLGTLLVRWIAADWSPASLDALGEDWDG